MVKRIFLTMMMAAATCLAFASCTSDPSDEPGRQEDEMTMNKILLSLAAALAICFTACAQKKEKQSMDNNSSKTLVAYFSATGTTAKAARSIADITGGELFEIAPQNPYTDADLDWKEGKLLNRMSNNAIQNWINSITD